MKIKLEISSQNYSSYKEYINYIKVIFNIDLNRDKVTENSR